MATMPRIAERAERLLGIPVVATSPVAGGDVCTTVRLRLSDGSTAALKTRPRAPADFFATEARGLTWLREAGAVAVPEVLAHDAECLILEWVEPGRATPDATTGLGRGLAALHASGAETFGAAHDGFVGMLPMPNKPADTWAEFFATRRLLPYLRLARDRGNLSPEDAADVEKVGGRLAELAGPDEPPARLHGDLWNGNVVWARDGGAQSGAHLIDPAAYGGHRETDLAMLALFGLPQLHRVLDAYQEVTPLAEGWEDRVGLHQLFPVLVHACTHGPSYGTRAGELARRYR